MAEQGVLTRRRVLTGIAWATPAILIATAVPAAAASTVAGKLALFQTSATATATTLYVGAAVTYAGAVSPSPDAPVSAVRAEITVLTTRIVTTTAPTFTGAGWTYTGRTASGTNSIFTFTWVGTNLSAAFLTTTPLVAAIPKAASMNTLALSVIARGTSLSTNVASAAAPVTAVNAGVINFAVAAASRITYVASFTPIGGGAAFPAYRFQGTVRNSGVTASGTTRPAAQPITGTTVVVSIPATYTTGVRYDRVAGSVGAGWTLTSGPTLVAGNYVLTYTYTGAPPVPPNATRDTTTLDFMMRAIVPKTLNIATMTATGTSAGLPLTITHIGPTA